jgi:hypothetical protein
VDWDGAEALGVADGAIEVVVVSLAAIDVVPGINVVVEESCEVVVVDVTGGTQFVLLYIFKAP